MPQFPTFDKTEIRTHLAALSDTRDEVTGLSDFDADQHAEYLAISELVFKGKTNQMRASKPKPGKNADDAQKALVGKAAYVWRWVGFWLVRDSRLQCMPCTDTFDLPAYDENGRWKSALARPMAKELDKVVDVFVKTVPVDQQPGTMRWGRALGMIG